MKKIIFNILASIAVCGALNSCSGEEAPVVNGASFEIQTYDDFLWDKDAVDTVKFSITADFKECDDLRKPIVLALCDNKGQIISEDLAEVYISGEKAAGNKIDIYPKAAGEQITEVGIVVNDAALAEDCTFNWHIKLCSKGQLESLSSIDKGAESLIGEQDPYISGMDIHIKNVHVANTLKVWTNTGLIVLLIALAAAHILSRMVNGSVKFTRLIIDYGDGEIRYDGIRGAYKVVLTNQKIKVGLFHRFFVGKVYVITNEFWTSELTIKKTYGQNLMFSTKGDYILPDEAVRKEEFVIKNEEGRSATLRTN